MPVRSLLSVLAIVVAVGAGPAGATADGASQTEFVLRRDRVLVGDFGGYGGQLNQHVYAKISGPPPALSTMEARVVALRPQLVRIFFNTSEWTNEDRMASFVRTVELAERADAEINITWQGSTFEFVVRDSSGMEIRRVTSPSSPASLEADESVAATWDQRDAGGHLAGSGDFTVSVAYTAAGSSSTRTEPFTID